MTLPYALLTLLALLALGASLAWCAGLLGVDCVAETSVLDDE